MGKLIRVVVCGPTGVGKTSLIEQCIYGNYNTKRTEDVSATIEDTYNAIVDSDRGTKERLRIYELGGKSRIERHFVECADAFLLVYDITDTRTLASVTELRRQLEESRGKREIIFVLCGNKLDKLKSETADSNDLNRWANTSKTYLFKTSVQDRQSVCSMFIWIVSRVIQSQSKSAFTFGKKDTKSFMAVGGLNRTDQD